MYPSYRRTASIISLSAGSTIARASSGSRSCSSSVEPLISANSAVRVLRSPSRVAIAGVSVPLISRPADFFGGSSAVGAASDSPHESQNRASMRLSAPHDGHLGESFAPHLSQKRAPSRFSPEPLAQRILMSQLVEQRLGVFQVGGVEAFGEPVVDVGEHRARLISLALVCEQSREARRRAQLQRLGALLSRNLDCPFKAGLRLRNIGTIS